MHLEERASSERGQVQEEEPGRAHMLTSVNRHGGECIFPPTSALTNIAVLENLREELQEKASDLEETEGGWAYVGGGWMQAGCAERPPHPEKQGEGLERRAGRQRQFR